MNGQSESDNKRFDKLEDRMGTTENKVGNLETAFTGLEKMSDERHKDLGAAIKGVKTQGWAIIVMILTAAVVAIITNAMK